MGKGGTGGTPEGSFPTILSACSSVNWEERTVPTRPVLSSMTRATLNGVKGVWMDERDAGALALWLEEVSP